MRAAEQRSILALRSRWSSRSILSPSSDRVDEDAAHTSHSNLEQSAAVAARLPVIRCESRTATSTNGNSADDAYFRSTGELYGY